MNLDYGPGKYAFVYRWQNPYLAGLKVSFHPPFTNHLFQKLVEIKEKIFMRGEKIARSFWVQSRENEGRGLR